MYVQIEKTKENKSRAVANSINQKKEADIKDSRKKKHLNFLSLTVRDTTEHRNDSKIQKTEALVQRARASTESEKVIIKEAIMSAVDLMTKKYFALFLNKPGTVDAALKYLGLNKKDSMSLVNDLLGGMNTNKDAMVAGSEVDWDDKGFAAAVAGDINGLEVNRAFLEAELSGVDSRTSTMIHEAAHIFRNANTQAEFEKDIIGVSGVKITPDSTEVYNNAELLDLPVALRQHNAQNVERFFTS